MYAAGTGRTACPARLGCPREGTFSKTVDGAVVDGFTRARAFALWRVSGFRNAGGCSAATSVSWCRPRRRAGYQAYALLCVEIAAILTPSQTSQHTELPTNEQSVGKLDGEGGQCFCPA